MSNAAAGIPVFADPSPQIFSLLAAVFIVGVCLAGSLIVLFLLFRELAGARAFHARQSSAFPRKRFWPFSRRPQGKKRPQTPAPTSSNYRRGQFQGRRNSFA